MNQEAWIKKAVRYAKRKRLDLQLIHANISIDTIEPREGYLEKKVIRIREAMIESGAWPAGLSPVFLVCDRRGSECMILDGHHRVEAAMRAGLKRVPAIVASWETFDALRDKYFDVASWDYMDVDRFIALLGILNDETDPVVRKWIEYSEQANHP